MLFGTNFTYQGLDVQVVGCTPKYLLKADRKPEQFNSKFSIEGQLRTSFSSSDTNAGSSKVVDGDDEEGDDDGGDEDDAEGSS